MNEAADEAGADQRRHPRYPESLTVDVHVHVVPIAGVQDIYEAVGRTVNIGRGGVLMSLDERLVEDQTVKMRFARIPEEVRIWPLVNSGRVIRLEPSEIFDLLREEVGGHLVAVEFSEPLEELDVPSG